MKEDSELLLGVFVVQLGYGTASQVMAAAGEWATRRKEGTRLADVLMQRGLLDRDKRRMVEEVMGRALQVNDGDVARTLQSLASGLNTLMRSLSNSMVGDGANTMDTRAQSDSLEGSENVVDEPIGRYDFETGPLGTTQELGRGGIGRVVVAHDRYLGRDVAMKELLPEHTSNPQLATSRTVALEQRFLREARLTGQLEHPAVVPVFELGRRLDGGLYYTMQRVRGRTLYDLMKSAKGLEGRLGLVAPYLTACQAIAYAHSRAVVHRDVKPQNVMVGPFGETFVLDWGLARVKGRSDPRAKDLKLQPDITGNVLEGGAIGTPSYMSPEQAEGKVEAIDERSDVWCLGAVLYELLTGRPPYTGVNPFDVLAKIVKEKVKPVRELEPDAPPELAAIAEKALQHAKADRYPTAAEVANDVAAWLRGGRVGAHDYSSWELTRRFAKKNKVALTVASVAVGILSVAGVVAVQKVRQERDAARAFAQLFLEDVSDTLAPIAGSTPLVDQLTHKTLDFYRSNVDPHRGPRSDRQRLGIAWKKIGRLAFEVDKNDEAESAYAFALEVARSLVDEDPKDPAARALLSEALIGQADVEQDRGATQKSEALLIEAVGHAEAGVEADGESIDALDTLSRGNNRLGVLRIQTGRLQAAVDPTKRSLEVDRKLAALQPESDLMQTNVAISLGSLANVQRHNKRVDEAVKLIDEAIGHAEGVLKRHPANGPARRAAADCWLARAEYARLQNDTRTAKVAVEAAYAHAADFIAKEPQDSQGRSHLAMAEVQLGRAEDAYQRFRGMGEAAFDSDTIDAFAFSMYFTGRYSELIAAAERAPTTNKKTLYTYAALSAAARGDAKASGALATEASKAENSELHWLLDVTRAQLEKGTSELELKALALGLKLEDALRSGDDGACTQALAEYARRVP